MQNLVEITEKKHGVIIDLRYATNDNVCGHKLYSHPFCFLHSDSEKALDKAVELAKAVNLKIKIWDCFRPLEVQKYMFDKFPSDNPNGGFVSNPSGGVIPHCRGAAIDLTLCNLDGSELEMGTDFDEFSSLAFHGCREISLEAQKNRLTLAGIMSLAGFDFYQNEWWHYQLFNARQYEVVNLPDVEKYVTQTCI
jgi:D-alanyl-D-alanine dipeptidase